MYMPKNTNETLIAIKIEFSLYLSVSIIYLSNAFNPINTMIKKTASATL